MMSVSLAPGTVRPLTKKPNSAATTAEARKAPTIPPQKRSGTNTVKCQTAMPIMTQTTRLIGDLPCFFRGRWRFGFWRRRRRAGARGRCAVAVSVGPRRRPLAGLGVGRLAGSGRAARWCAGSVGGPAAAPGSWGAARWPVWRAAARPARRAARLVARGRRRAGARSARARRGHSRGGGRRPGGERGHDPAVLLHHQPAAAHVDLLALLPLHEHGVAMKIDE